MKYLKHFANAQEAQSVMAIWPFNTVYSIEGQHGVKIHSAAAPVPTHDYVEIGGVKWATMNVGANSVTDLGLFFRWGETQGYTFTQLEKETLPAYRYMDENDKFTKYNDTDGKTVLDLSDDAVNAAWGGNWRMPTQSEFAALNELVDFEQMTNYQGSGVNGWLLTDKTDSSKVLFFPGIPSITYGSNYSSQLYWSNNLLNGDSSAFGAICYYSSMWLTEYDWSYYRTGFNIARGVLDD